MSNKNRIFLILICILFLLTRLYKINEIPPSVYWDEASIGYNAYSIVLSGKDEWGDLLPLHFRAFGEFKLPIYVYASSIFVKLFGLNEFSVRLPAVLFSLGSVILTYLLSKKIFKENLIALFSSLSLTFSPWFFIISRTGIEATAGLMFYLLGIYLFLINRKWFILLSVLSFIISMYSYNSFRLLSPVVLFLLIIIRRKELKVYIRQNLIMAFITIAFFILSLIPIYRLFVYDSGIARVQNLGGVSEPLKIVKNYLSHFSPNFLFEGAKNFRFQQEGFGQIYILELLLFIAGVLYIVKKKQKIYFLPLLFIFLAPIPASITKEAPHALRSLSIIPFFCIVLGCGVKYIEEFAHKKVITNLGILSIYLIFFGYYFYSFNTSYPIYSSKDWQSAYKEVYKNYAFEFEQYDQVIISDTFAQPYIFALFYLKYDPNRFREEVKRNEVGDWGFSTVASFNKFNFGKIKKIVNSETKGAIVFTSPDEMLDYIQPIDRINFPDGSIALFVYKL